MHVAEDKVMEITVRIHMGAGEEIGVHVAVDVSGDVTVRIGVDVSGDVDRAQSAWMWPGTSPCAV